MAKSKFTRNEIWRHNSYLGRVSSALVGMRAIAQSNTTTEESKEKAKMVSLELTALYKSLKERAE